MSRAPGGAPDIVQRQQRVATARAESATRLAQLRERIQALSDKFVGAPAGQKIRRDFDALKAEPFDVIIQDQEYYDAFDDPSGAEKHAAESDWNINNELRLIFTGFLNHDAQASTDNIVRTSGPEIEAVKAAYRI